MSTQQWSDKILKVDLLDDPEMSDELTALTEQMETSAKNLVLNFDNVNFLNSSNISRLLKLRKTLHAQKRRLILCSIPHQVWAVFLVTGLDTMFDVAEDTATALASLQIHRSS